MQKRSHSFKVKRQNAVDRNVTRQLAEAVQSTSSPSARSRRPRPTSSASTRRARKAAAIPSTTNPSPAAGPQNTEEEAPSSDVQSDGLLTNEAIENAATSGQDAATVSVGNLYTYPTSSLADTSLQGSPSAEAASSTAQPASDSSHKLQTTAVIGIVAAAAGLLIIAGLAWFFWRRHKSKNDLSESEQRNHGYSGNEKSGYQQFDDYDSNVNYPEAQTQFEGRPKSFLDSLESTLSRNSTSRIKVQQQPLSYHQSMKRSQPSPSYGSEKHLTNPDPFSFGFGRGAAALNQALAGDLRQSTHPDKERDPFSDAFNNEVLASRYEDDNVSAVSQRQSQPSKWF